MSTHVAVEARAIGPSTSRSQPAWRIFGPWLGAIGLLVVTGLYIGLVGGGLEQLARVIGIAGDDVGGAHHPQADAFHPARVGVAGVAKRQFGIGRMNAADVTLRQSALGANENFP